ncbi:hypothetical protein ACILE2_01685 [Capnocytophaga canimorsus]|uniref:hypothetical protein n=1 Tax=Capnocytophaga canimorsus TaxID=28188 RepID=UPI0037D6FDEF
MNKKDFFSQLDARMQGHNSQSEMEKAKAQQQFSDAKGFAQKLIKTLAPYIKGFRQRGFICKEKTDNLPFYRLEIQNKSHHIELGIYEEKNGYRLFCYSNNVQRHLPIRIGHYYDGLAVENELQNLFTIFL